MLTESGTVYGVSASVSFYNKEQPTIFKKTGLNLGLIHVRHHHAHHKG